MKYRVRVIIRIRRKKKTEMRLEKVFVPVLYPGHGTMFVRNDSKVCLPYPKLISSFFVGVSIQFTPAFRFPH
jgi:hypothetical protein